MKRFGSAAWNGGLREGKGSVSTESRALETYPYTFFSRYGEKPGTNPEELLSSRSIGFEDRAPSRSINSNVVLRRDWMLSSLPRF